MCFGRLPDGTELSARWREAGEWWDGEAAQEWIRYVSAGSRREESLDLGFRHLPFVTGASEEVDHSEDWSLRTRKLRDGKMKHPFASEPPRLYSALPAGVSDAPYVPLHIASGYDFGRGVMLPEEAVQFAVMNGLPGLCIADRFSLVGAVELARGCRDSGIHPLIGASFELETGGEIVLIAQSKRGYVGLSTLITRCHLEEERLLPILRLQHLWSLCEDLICLTGGSHGPLLPMLLKGQIDSARNFLGLLREHFGRDRLYLEADFAYQPWDIAHLRGLCQLSKEMELSMVAGGLVTHARRHHFPVQEVIGCAHNLSLIHEVKGRKPRFHEDGFPFRSINAERFLRTPFEINELYSEIPELVSNSLQLLSKCDKDVMPSRTTLPKLFDDPENALREVTYAGAHQKYPLMTTGIRRRIDLEVERICRLQYADHFLTIWDACRWASRRGYQFSGRGSVVDSVVAYCLDLSRIDAYKHRLHFDRFLPADGTKRPDIDIDFPAKRRNEVRSYMVQKYGEERVATVAAIGAYCTRGIIREVGKVFGLPDSTISFLSKRVHGGIAPDKLEAALEKRPELKGSNIPKERFRWVLSLAERMMDIPRNMRAHSSGVVISSRPLHETVPVMWSATEDPNGGNLRIIQWDKRSAKHYFDKFDILCLRGQDVLEGTQDRVVVRDRTFDVANLPSDDPDVYATMRSGELIGIPQSASPAMRQAHIRLKTKNLEDASLVQAGIRPGVGGAVKLNEMIARRHGKPFTFSHPDLEEILGITYGIIVFQEQVDQLLQKFAGYSGGEAEDTREQIHKRRREDFGREIRERVLARIQANGYGLQVAEEVFELIAGFKGYGFAQGHALAFAEISVRSIYCQQHYPAEYFASLLDAQPAGYYGPCTLVNEARNRGVAVLPVDVNLSEVGFAVENVKSTMDPQIVVPNGGIRVALAQISGLNRELQLRISLARPFESVFDFAMKTNPDRDDLERLILVGAFDELQPNRRQLLWALPAILDYARAFNTPGTLPLGAPIPLLPEGIVDFNEAERAIHERRYLDLDIDQHLMSFERERVASRGGVTTTVARRLENGRKAIVVGNPIRLRFPPTPSGKRVVFFDLEDETGLLNVTCFDETYQRDGHAIVCSPYVTIIGEAQVRDDHVAFLASRVFPYKPHIITLLGVPDAAKTGSSDMGWGHSPLPIVTADFLVG